MNYLLEILLKLSAVTDRQTGRKQTIMTSSLWLALATIGRSFCQFEEFSPIQPELGARAYYGRDYPG